MQPVVVPQDLSIAPQNLSSSLVGSRRLSYFFVFVVFCVFFLIPEDEMIILGKQHGTKLQLGKKNIMALERNCTVVQLQASLVAPGGQGP